MFLRVKTEADLRLTVGMHLSRLPQPPLPVDVKYPEARRGLLCSVLVRMYRSLKLQVPEFTTHIAKSLLKSTGHKRPASPSLRGLASRLWGD